MITIVTENGLTFNRTDAASSWRLVYKNGETTAILFQAVGHTDTIHNIEEFATQQEGLDRITALELTLIVPPTPPAPPQNS